MQTENVWMSDIKTLIDHTAKEARLLGMVSLARMAAAAETELAALRTEAELHRVAHRGTLAELAAKAGTLDAARALVAKWQEGYDMVYTKREKNESYGWFKNTLSSFFAFVFNKLSQKRDQQRVLSQSIKMIFLSTVFLVE